jgi:hypothetical protein
MISRSAVPRLSTSRSETIATHGGYLIATTKGSDRINRIDRIFPALRTRAGIFPATVRNNASNAAPQAPDRAGFHPGSRHKPIL